MMDKHGDVVTEEVHTTIRVDLLLALLSHGSLRTRLALLRILAVYAKTRSLGTVQHLVKHNGYAWWRGRGRWAGSMWRDAVPADSVTAQARALTLTIFAEPAIPGSARARFLGQCSLDSNCACMRSRPR